MHTHESPVAEIVAPSSLKFDYGTKFKVVAGNLTRFLGFQTANRGYQIATITVTLIENLRYWKDSKHVACFSLLQGHRYTNNAP